MPHLVPGVTEENRQQIFLGCRQVGTMIFSQTDKRHPPDQGYALKPCYNKTTQDVFEFFFSFYKKDITFTLNLQREKKDLFSFFFFNI